MIKIIKEVRIIKDISGYKMALAAFCVCLFVQDYEIKKLKKDIEKIRAEMALKETVEEE